MKKIQLKGESFKLKLNRPVTADLTAYSGTNLIKNSSFEHLPNKKYIYKMNDDWYNDGWQACDGFKTYGDITDEMAYSGRKSLKCYFRNMVLQKYCEVKKDTDYVFSFWYYIGSDENPNKLAKWSYVCVVNYLGLNTACNGEWYYRMPYCWKYFDGWDANAEKTVYDKWTRIDFHFNSKDNDRINLAMRYVAGNDETAPIHLDNICLYEKADIDSGKVSLDIPAGIYSDTATLLGEGDLAFDFNLELDKEKVEKSLNGKCEEFGCFVRSEFDDLTDAKKVVLENKSGKQTFRVENIPENLLNSAIIITPYAVVGGKTYYSEESCVKPISFLMTALYNKVKDEEYVESEELRNKVREILNKSQNLDCHIYNDREKHCTTMGALSAAVYHMTSYFDDDSGRKYTQEMIDIENNRIKEMGFKQLRTMFRSTWSVPEDEPFNGWKWDTPELLNWYKEAKDMQKIGVDLVITASWLLDYYVWVDPKFRHWYREHPYLHGDGEDFYGESKDCDFTGMDDYHIRLVKASKRYGKWVVEALKAFKAHGVNNVKYILPFTEPNAFMTKLDGDWHWAYVQFIVSLNEALVAAGLRDEVKIWGPNQSPLSLSDRKVMMLYECIKALPDKKMIDVYTDHSGKSLYGLYDDSMTAGPIDYDFFEKGYESLSDVLHDAVGDPNVQIFSDEYYGGSMRPPQYIKELFPVHMASGLIGQAKAKTLGACLWELSDQLWPSSHSNNFEFDDGFHHTGVMPSLLLSYVPHLRYYSTALITRYTTPMNEIVQGEFRAGDELFYAAYRNSETGEMTVLMANTATYPQSFNLNFSAPTGKKWHRHSFDPVNTVPDERARIPGIDATFADGKITDSIAPLGVTIYTTLEY